MIPVSVVTRYHYGVTVVATPRPGGLDWDGSVLLGDWEKLLAFLRKDMWTWGKERKEKKLENPKCSLSNGPQ